MHTSHTIRRLAAAIALAAAVAALGVPTALAAGHARTLSDGRTPDPRDDPTSQSIPRVGNGVFGPAVPTPPGPVTIGPNTVGPSPDTADAALRAHSPTVTLAKPSGFAWREFGIGAGAATAAIVLLLGLRASLPAARERREIARASASA
jgi:hypothetical protein